MIRLVGIDKEDPELYLGGQGGPRQRVAGSVKRK